MSTVLYPLRQDISNYIFFADRDSNDSSNSNGPVAERKRKRRSRWMGSENEKAVIPGMPTILPSDLNESQREAYIGRQLIHCFTNV